VAVFIQTFYTRFVCNESVYSVIVVQPFLDDVLLQTQDRLFS